MGELNDEDPEVRKAQVHAAEAKEERSLLDRLKKFSDWGRVTKAIPRLKHLAKEVKGLNQGPMKLQRLRKEKMLGNLS